MKKIIFDLDDTLYSSRELRNKREEKIIEFLGEKAFSYFELKKNGMGTIESFKILGFKKEEFFEIINSVEIELERDEQLIKVLKELKEYYKLIVLSNSPRLSIKIVLERLGIFDLIDESYSGEDFLNEKPDENCFFMVEKNDICVGNSFRKDLKIPKKKGAITILISDTENELSNFTIPNIHSILKVLGRSTAQ